MSNVIKHFLEVTAEAQSEAEWQVQKDEHKNWVDRLFELILTDESESIARLETELEVTQMEAVDDLIENTDWGSTPQLRRLRGGRGTRTVRLEALRLELRKQGKGSK